MARVLLVGFMGSGKTTVGRLLADRLDWRFRDFDEEVVSREGLSISEIFRQHGEGRFRAAEARIGSEFLARDRVVLASGGGWPVAEGRMDSLPGGTLSVWLRVSAVEAVARARRDRDTRPLLVGEAPVAEAERLLRVREPFYARAEIALDTSGEEPEELAKRIEKLVNLRGQGTAPVTTTVV